MKKIFLPLLCLLAGLSCFGQQPVPPAATQAQVNSGTATFPYVSPATLAGWTGGGGLTNSPGISTNAVINIANAAVLNARPVYKDFGQFSLMRDFGATNNGVMISSITNVQNATTVTIGSGAGFRWSGGTNTYFETNSPLLGNEVGQTIMLYPQVTNNANSQPFATTNCFTTTIASVVNSYTLTLASAPPLGFTNSFGVFGTPNDVYVQNAFNAISNQFSVQIYAESGIYVITNAPLGTNNAQLICPPITPQPFGTSYKSTGPILRLEGSFRPKITQAVGAVNYIPNIVTATFWSTCTNLGGGSMIDGRNFVTSQYAQIPQVPCNSVRFETENTCWRGAWNNNGTLLCLDGFNSESVKHCLIDSGYTLYHTPHGEGTNTYGLKLTPPNSSGEEDIDSDEIFGFYSGVTYGEHVNVTGLAIGDCVQAINSGRVYQFTTNGVGTGYYSSSGGHAGWWLGVDFCDCQVNLANDNNVAEVYILGTSETHTSAYSPATNVFDPNYGLTGKFMVADQTRNLVFDPNSFIQTEHLASGSLYGYLVTNSYMNVSGTFNVNGPAALGGEATISSLTDNNGNVLTLADPVTDSINIRMNPHNGFDTIWLFSSGIYNSQGGSGTTVAGFAPLTVGGAYTLPWQWAFYAWTNGDFHVSDNLFVSNNITSYGTFTGNGSGLTSLAAPALVGIVPMTSINPEVVTNNEPAVALGNNLTLSSSSAGGYSMSYNVTGVNPSTNLIISQTAKLLMEDYLGNPISITASNVTASGVFTGNGSGLTSLAAANLTGTIPSAGVATNAAGFFAAAPSGGSFANGSANNTTQTNITLANPNISVPSTNVWMAGVTNYWTTGPKQDNFTNWVGVAGLGMKPVYYIGTNGTFGMLNLVSNVGANCELLLSYLSIPGTCLFNSGGFNYLYSALTMNGNPIQSVTTIAASGTITTSAGVVGASVTTTGGTHTPAAVTVGASPFSFNNNTGVNLECYVSDSAAYSLTKNGVAIYGSLASDSYVMLQTNCTLVITYASTTPAIYTNSW